jgi:hypothetical protein
MRWHPEKKSLGAAAPKLPLEFADGGEAEPVRARLRERVSSPCGDDGGVEPARGWLRRRPDFFPLHGWGFPLPLGAVFEWVDYGRK